MSQRIPGTVIAESPDPACISIGCPSIIVLPNGHYLASHSHFSRDEGFSNNETFVYLSENRGTTWERTAHLKGQWWSTLFNHEDDVYIIGVHKKDGRIVLRRSTDNGQTWTEPSDAKSGVLREEEHTLSSPTPVVFHNGRIWRAFEDRSGPGTFVSSAKPFMLSASLGSDWLDAANWTVSEMGPVFNQEWQGLLVRPMDAKVSRASEHPNYTADGGWIEGNAVPDRQGNMKIILRVHEPVNGDSAAIMDVSNNGRHVTFDPGGGFIRYPGGSKKFSIRFDKVSDKYWSLVNLVHYPDVCGNSSRIRNTVALTCSDDLIDWRVRSVILHHPDSEKHGFQYIDWQIEGSDMIFVSRTAFATHDSTPHNCHDANFLTFHRIPEFRNRCIADPLLVS